MKAYHCVRTALFLALGALVLVFLKSIVLVLQYFIGALVLFYGVEEIVYTAFTEKKRYNVHSLYWNAIEIAIGIALLAFVKHGHGGIDAFTVVCTVWAVWSMLRETRELVDATIKFREERSAIPDILESLVVIGFSLSLLISPTAKHAEIHLYLLAAECWTKALLPLLNLNFKRKKAPAEAPAEPLSDEGLEEIAPTQETNE